MLIVKTEETTFEDSLPGVVYVLLSLSSHESINRYKTSSQSSAHEPNYDGSMDVLNSHIGAIKASKFECLACRNSEVVEAVLLDLCAEG